MRLFPGLAGFKKKENTMIKISQGLTMRKVNMESSIISAFNRYFEGGSAGEEAGKLKASLMDAQTKYFQKKIWLLPAFQQ
jgi:hypothetical protein